MSMTRPSAIRNTAPSVAIAVGGIATVLLRAGLGGGVAGTTALAVTYVALTLTVATGPAVRSTAPALDARALPMAITLAVGVLAVAGARLVGGAGVSPPASVVPVGLSLLAAVGEEAFFRGFVFRLVQGAHPGPPTARTVTAVLTTAVLFAIVHVPAYGVRAFPVDLAAGALFGWQRATSGSWAAPAATHALANVLAVIR